MAKPAPGRRPVLWVAVAVVVVIAAAALLVASSSGGATSTTSSKSTTSTTTTSTTTAACAGSSTSQTITIISGPLLVGQTGKVSAGVTCPDGHLGTILTYQYGQQISIRVSVPSSLDPVAIQTVVDGNPQNTNPWDVNSTGHTYVLNYGLAAESPLTVPGLHDVYAVVTFADKTTATSNVVYFTVAGTPAPPA